MLHSMNIFVGILSAGAVLAACSTSSSSCPNPGGAVTGSPDSHCTTAQTTSQASCHPDGGIVMGDGGGGTGYGPTLSNASGDDDDCKYHLSWTSSPVCEASGVTFTATATNKTDGSPVVGADLVAEVFLSLTHPSPTPVVHTKEGLQGTYVTDPVKLDAPGQWTIRFHLFDSCDDTAPDSPHGHIAFYVEVP